MFLKVIVFMLPYICVLLVMMLSVVALRWICFGGPQAFMKKLRARFGRYSRQQRKLERNYLGFRNW